MGSRKSSSDVDPKLKTSRGEITTSSTSFHFENNDNHRLKVSNMMVLNIMITQTTDQ